MKRLLLSILILVYLQGLAFAASATDIDKMTTYATLLGRAIGCGINTKPTVERVARWFDQRFEPGTEQYKTYMMIFMSGMEMNARNQANGQSPDSCSEVRRQFELVNWP